MIQSARIRGVQAPVVTPFKADLAPDSQRFIAHCKWPLSQNCGLAVFGTNSEANSLSMEERAMLLDELVAAGASFQRMKEPDLKEQTLNTQRPTSKLWNAEKAIRKPGKQEVEVRWQ